MMRFRQKERVVYRDCIGQGSIPIHKVVLREVVNESNDEKKEDERDMNNWSTTK